MAELVVLSLDRAELDANMKRARRGDEEAMQTLEHIWDNYADLACFLCDHEVERPVFTLMLPERGLRAKVIAAPLCRACRALPSMQRLGRAIKLLKKMWGKGTHFTFAPRRR
jgi:hypothetical protein